ALTGRVLVIADGCDKLEPPVEQLAQPPVELGDLVPECLELSHEAYRSPASTATDSRFAGGASGQTQPGSYAQDGLYAKLKSSTSGPWPSPEPAPLPVWRG